MIKLLSRKPTALRLVNPSAAKIKIFTASALDRKSGSAGMPRPISYAVFCLKKKTEYSVTPEHLDHNQTPHASSDSRLAQDDIQPPPDVRAPPDVFHKNL